MAVMLQLVWKVLEAEPCTCLAVPLDQPSKRSDGRPRLLRPQVPAYGGLILSIEIRRTELRTQADAPILADAHIPDRLAVSGYLPVQMGRARAWHGLNHRTISAACSTATFSPVDGPMRMMMASRSPIRISTSLAPACFAARRARAISA